MTGRIISEKLLRWCALRVTILQRSLPLAPVQACFPFPEKNLIRERKDVALSIRGRVFVDRYSYAEAANGLRDCNDCTRKAIEQEYTIIKFLNRCLTFLKSTDLFVC